jgi:predicted dehydrogenase
VAGLALASLSQHPGFSADGRPGVQDELRIGVIGTGVRGKYLIGNLPPSVRVTALCDCSTDQIASTLEPKGAFIAVLEHFRASDAGRCKMYQDYRRMFDREKLDGVMIAACDHHHVLAAMLALQGGLDVYLEKPLSVTIREGRLLADMVGKTRRILQVGSQQRTMEINQIGCAFVRGGGLGKITRVDLPNYPGPIAAPKHPEEPVPGGMDWDLFCGPTRLRPYHRNLWVKDAYKVGTLLWRGWDLYRDYSGHMMTNWGAHSVDMVQLALGTDNTGPVEIRAVRPEDMKAIGEPWKSKTPEPVDANETRFWPVTMRYATGVELRFIHADEVILFHGEKGRMRMKRNFFETDPPNLVTDKPDAATLNRWRGAGNVARPHLENWLGCVRTRKMPNAPVEVGHRTVTICHLANLARELGRPLRWDPTREEFQDDKDANDHADRPRRKGFELPKV